MTDPQTEQQTLPATRDAHVPSARDAATIVPQIPTTRLEQTIQNLERQLQSYDLALKLAEKFAKARLVPSSFIQQNSGVNLEAVAIALIAGMEVGFSPIQALQSFYVINGIPTMYGMGPAAIVEQSGVMEWIKDEWIPDMKGGGGYRCTTQRKGKPEPYVTEFTMEEADKGKLLTKVGPWQWDQQEMCMYRARGRMWKRYYADVMKGIQQSEDTAAVEGSLEQSLPALDARQESLQDHLAKAVATTAPLKTAAPAEPVTEPPQIKTLKVTAGKVLDLQVKTPEQIWQSFTLETTSGAHETYAVAPNITLQPEIDKHRFIDQQVLVTWSLGHGGLRECRTLTLTDPSVVGDKAPAKKPAGKKKIAGTPPSETPQPASQMTIAGSPPTTVPQDLDAETIADVGTQVDYLNEHPLGKALLAGVNKDFGITSADPLTELQPAQIEPYRAALKAAVQRTEAKR